jgi:hypothetical protein
VKRAAAYMDVFRQSCEISQLRKLAPSVLLGQVISLLIACTGIFSTYLANDNISIPTSQSTINYALLCLYALHRWRQAGFTTNFKLQVAWWKYALLAFADVEANYLVVKAYSYTTITSIMLIDCWTIPCVMLISRAFLHAQVCISASTCMATTIVQLLAMIAVLCVIPCYLLTTIIRFCHRISLSCFLFHLAVLAQACGRSANLFERSRCACVFRLPQF